MYHAPLCFRTLLALSIVASATGASSRAADPAAGGRDRAAEPVKKIDVEEFDRMRTGKDAVVLDVRTPEEFAAGHVPGAVNLPVNEPEFGKKLAGLDKDKTYLVHCARGGRSATATKQMTGLGLKGLFDFSGGFVAWEKAGKPVEK